VKKMAQRKAQSYVRMHAAHAAGGTRLREDERGATVTPEAQTIPMPPPICPLPMMTTFLILPPAAALMARVASNRGPVRTAVDEMARNMLIPTWTR
jgi:hypothetical protein